MFYLTIVNKILPHCHSWLARQYLPIGWPYIQKDNTFERTLVNSVSSSSVELNNCLGAQNRFIKRFFSDYPEHMLWLRNKKTIWAVACDFQQWGILTSVDSDKHVQPLFKLRTSKRCSISSLTLIEYSSDDQRLWSDCAYAQADLRLCWSHIPHCLKSHALGIF